MMKVMLSDPFKVKRGIRHGCSLSGLAFSLFWLLEEPLVGGGRMDIKDSSPSLTQTLELKKFTTLRRLVDTAGPDFKDTGAVAQELGLRSLRHTEAIIKKRTSNLSREELNLIKEYPEGTETPDKEDNEAEGSVQVNGATEEVKGQKELSEKGVEAQGSAEGVCVSTDAVQAGGSEEGLADGLSSQLTEDSMRDEEQWSDITEIEVAEKDFYTVEEINVFDSTKGKAGGEVIDFFPNFDKCAVIESSHSRKDTAAHEHHTHNPRGRNGQSSSDPVVMRRPTVDVHMILYAAENVDKPCRSDHLQGFPVLTIEQRDSWETKLTVDEEKVREEEEKAREEEEKAREEEEKVREEEEKVREEEKKAREEEEKAREEEEKAREEEEKAREEEEKVREEEEKAREEEEKVRGRGENERGRGESERKRRKWGGRKRGKGGKAREEEEKGERKRRK
ncbi:hypothetical protein QTP86_013298 [Hemibagrus guttatus]|nr:hypothetical protein QTP86_013298 [Hemibagrus guttatus]